MESTLTDGNTETEPTEDTVAQTETVQSVVSETDMDIIMREGHPIYYGSVEQSHTIWDDIEKGRIHFGDKNYGYNDNPILSMDAYRNSDLIRLILINFKNFKEETSVSLEEALKIAASYMPFDIMDQWYEYSGSEAVVPDGIREEDSTYYVISYRLTDEGGNAYYANEHEYSGTIDVIIQTNNDVVESIDITFGTPRWMRSLDKNHYHREEWSCNLYDYR